jgi:hypothetical protein
MIIIMMRIVRQTRKPTHRNPARAHCALAGPPSMTGDRHNCLDFPLSGRIAGNAPSSSSRLRLHHH